MRHLNVITADVRPAGYGAWMRDALGGAAPSEPEATCADCAMVAPPGQDAGHGFDAHTKCCAHLPFLANFLAGRILADGRTGEVSRHGRASTRARIRERLAVSPIGLHAPLPRRTLERLAHEHGDFGRVRSLVCPHFSDGAVGPCGIWEHRDATCATFFCKHVQGARAYRFWRALELLLKSVEGALARHCLIVLDFPIEGAARALASHDAAEADPTRGPELAPDPERYLALWGAWQGRSGWARSRASRSGANTRASRPTASSTRWIYPAYEASARQKNLRRFGPALMPVFTLPTMGRTGATLRTSSDDSSRISSSFGSAFLVSSIRASHGALSTAPDRADRPLDAHQPPRAECIFGSRPPSTRGAQRFGAARSARRGSPSIVLPRGREAAIPSPPS